MFVKAMAYLASYYYYYYYFNKPTVYTLGFEEQPASWPQELDFTPLSDVSMLQQGPVVVHVSRLNDFIRRAQELAKLRSDGRLPEAILYLPKEGQIPPEAIDYFDAIVQEGEEFRLLELLRCPYRLTIDEWIYELPVAKLFSQKEKPWQHEALPEEVRSHLELCPDCQKAFMMALEARRRFYRFFFQDPSNYALRELSEQKQILSAEQQRDRQLAAALTLSACVVLRFHIPKKWRRGSFAAAANTAASELVRLKSEDGRLLVEMRREANGTVWLWIETKETSLAGREVVALASKEGEQEKLGVTVLEEIESGRYGGSIYLGSGEELQFDDVVLSIK